MRVLIADGDAESRRWLETALRQLGYEVVAASSGSEAWSLVSSEHPSIVVADWSLPGLDGPQLVRNIRSQRQNGYICTLLVTPEERKQKLPIGLSAGVDDYLTKPFDRDDLVVRIRAAERIVRLERELASRSEQLRRLTLVDRLTGFGNRRSFDETLRRMHEHSRRYERPLSLLLIDVDRFKLYNDSLGRASGDDALKRVAESLVDSLRSADLPFRRDSDDFACLLPETEEREAATVAERLRGALLAAALPHPSNPPTRTITISCGVTTVKAGQSVEVQEMIGRASTALAAAKRAGRNRVELDGSPAPAASPPQPPAGRRI